MRTIDFLTRSFIISIAATTAIAVPSPSEADTESAPDQAPVIVLDPGHSGKDIHSTDKQTGLIDHDYPNHPEMEECFRVAKLVQAALEKKGYRVICTKSVVADSVSLRQRAIIAQNAGATLGVSIHDDHGKKFSSFAQVYAQNVGLWRGNTSDHPKATFSSAQTAATSRRWSTVIADQRSLAEGHKVDVTSVNFDGRPGIEPGNIPQVSLYGGSGAHPVPWIYNEVGGIGLGPKEEQMYACGLVNGIEKCIPMPKIAD
jgi:N-acetylmuramoyl-L-alanine amidase